jgi:hypothetical protein
LENDSLERGLNKSRHLLIHLSNFNMSLALCHVKPNTVRQLLRATSSTPRTAIISTSTQNRPAITNFNCHQTRSYASPKGPRAPVRKPPPAPKPYRPSQIPDVSRLKISLDIIVFVRALQRWQGAFNWRSPDEYFDYTDIYLKNLKNVDEAHNFNPAGKLGDCMMNE